MTTVPFEDAGTSSSSSSNIWINEDEGRTTLPTLNSTLASVSTDSPTETPTPLVSKSSISISTDDSWKPEANSTALSNVGKSVNTNGGELTVAINSASSIANTARSSSFDISSTLSVVTSSREPTLSVTEPTKGFNSTKGNTVFSSEISNNTVSSSNSSVLTNKITAIFTDMTSLTTDEITKQSVSESKSASYNNTPTRMKTTPPTLSSNTTQSEDHTLREHVSTSSKVLTNDTFTVSTPSSSGIVNASTSDDGTQIQPGVITPRSYTQSFNMSTHSEITTQRPGTFPGSSPASPVTDATTYVNKNMTDYLNIPTDCTSVLGLSIAISALVWFITVVAFLVCLLRMRHWWKRKLREERQRTDIWSLSTYHNTIINENFLDYKLAPSSDIYRLSDGKNFNKNTAKIKQARLSSGAVSGRSSSSYNDDFSFRQSFIRRETMNNDDRFRFKRSKSRLKRQQSSRSSDYFLQEQSPEFRQRTSTFNIGKRDKKDKHVLLNHDVLHLTGSRSLDNLEMLEIRSRNNSLSSSQNQPYYVTEL